MRSNALVRRTQLPLLLLAAACADSPTQARTPAPAAPVTLDSPRAATNRIGPAGGSVSTTSSTGVQYTLVFPSGSLIEDVDITITPITALRDATLDGGLIGGVDMQPAGLGFAKPATLHITLPQPPGGMRLIGVGYSERDGGVGLHPAGMTGGVATLPIAHFSGAAVGYGTLANLQQIAAAPASTTSQAFVNQLEALAAQNPVDDAAVLQVMRLWLTTVIHPMLAATTTDQDLLRAIGELDWWKRDATLTLGIHQDWPELLPTEYAAVEALLVAALVAAINGNADLCGSLTSFLPLENAIFWFERAVEWDLHVEGSPLGAFAVRREINQRCALPLIESITLPDTLRLGTPYSLDATFGVRFAGTTAPQGAPFEVSAINISGLTIQPDVGATNLQGDYTTVVTPHPPEGTHDIELLACLVLPRRRTCDEHAVLLVDTTISRVVIQVQVTVTPGSVTIAPSGTVQFSAAVDGNANQAVTWSATGGTITAGGLYTAGSTTGTFIVRAASVAHPLEFGEAVVIIAVPLLELTGKWKLKIVGNPDQTHCGAVNQTTSFGVADLQHLPHPQHPEGIIVGSWDYRGGFCGGNVSSASGTMSAIVGRNVDTGSRELLNWMLRIDNISNTQVCVAFIDEIRQTGAASLNPATQLFSSFELAVGEVNNALCPPQITFTMTMQRCDAFQVVCTSTFFPAMRPDLTLPRRALASGRASGANRKPSRS